MDEILIKYILNEVSNDEKIFVERCLAQDSKNQKHLKDLRFIWDESKRIEPELNTNENEAWKRFRAFAAKQKSLNGFKVRKLFLSLSAAAVVLATCGIIGYLFFYNGGTTITTNNKTLVANLPDKSQITLNAHSTLSYNKDFNQSTRNVQLTGEAFFRVTPDKRKPFDIKVNDVNVKVVGTSFNIRSSKDFTEVIVETGIVNVSSKGESILLHPGQKIEIGAGSNQLTVEENNDSFYNYYRSDVFHCSSTPLPELVHALNQTFNSNIEIADSATARLKISATFNKENLQDILEILSETLQLKINREENKIILKEE